MVAWRLSIIHVINVSMMAEASWFPMPRGHLWTSFPGFLAIVYGHAPGSSERNVGGYMWDT